MKPYDGSTLSGRVRDLVDRYASQAEQLRALGAEVESRIVLRKAIEWQRQLWMQHDLPMTCFDARDDAYRPYRGPAPAEVPQPALPMEATQ